MFLIELCLRVWHARQRDKTKPLSEIVRQILLEYMFMGIIGFLFPGLNIAFQLLCWFDKLNQKKKMTAKEKFLLTLEILGTIIEIAESWLDIDLSYIPDVLSIAIAILA